MQVSHPQILLLQRKEINKCRVKTEKSYSYSPEQLKSGWKNSVTATSSNLNNLVWSSLHTILTSTCILAFIYGACICRESNSVHPTNLFNDSTLAVNGWLFSWRTVTAGNAITYHPVRGLILPQFSDRHLWHPNRCSLVVGRLAASHSPVLRVKVCYWIQQNLETLITSDRCTHL